jgi:hypothetical protein
MHDIYGHFARDVKSQLGNPDGAQRHRTREPLQWEAGYSTGDRGNRLANRQPDTSVSLGHEQLATAPTPLPYRPVARQAAEVPPSWYGLA